MHLEILPIEKKQYAILFRMLRKNIVLHNRRSRIAAAYPFALISRLKQASS